MLPSAATSNNSWLILPESKPLRAPGNLLKVQVNIRAAALSEQTPDPPLVAYWRGHASKPLLKPSSHSATLKRQNNATDVVIQRRC